MIFLTEAFSLKNNHASTAVTTKLICETGMMTLACPCSRALAKKNIKPHSRKPENTPLHRLLIRILKPPLLKAVIEPKTVVLRKN